MSKQLIIYRLCNPVYGPEGNPLTLSVRLNDDGNTFSYSLYSGWQDSGMGNAMSNLQLRESLPTSRIKFDENDEVVPKYRKVSDLHKEIVQVLNTGCGSNKIKSFEIVNQFYLARE